VFKSAKYKFSFFLLLTLTVVTLLTNSCKKNTDDSVQYFLTNTSWVLASVQVFHFIGDTQSAKTDTLNTTCQTTQKFTFKSDNTCTYTNYHCITQNAAATWNLDPDNVHLYTTLSCQDTSKGSIVMVKAFSTASIITLGQYSMVLETGDIQPFYKATTVRTITRYGFVHCATCQ